MVDFLDDDDDFDFDGEEDDGLDSLPSRADIKALQEEIEALNKEKRGLLKGVKEERARRQEISGRLAQLSETVDGILTQRQRTAAELEGIGQRQSYKLPVTWTDEGEGFIDAETLAPLLTPYQQKIQQLEAIIQNSTGRNEAEREAMRVKEAIVGEDERYDAAYKKYQAARKWVSDTVSDYATTNGINRLLTSGEALDYVVNKDVEEEFSARFPGLRIEDVITAEDSKRHFRNALNNIAASLTPSEESNPNARRIDGRFQRVMRKPAGLGSQANARGGNTSIADKIEGLSSLDIMDISDDAAAALLRAMQEEEKSGGIYY